MRCLRSAPGIVSISIGGQDRGLGRDRSLERAGSGPTPAAPVEISASGAANGPDSAGATGSASVVGAGRLWRRAAAAIGDGCGRAAVTGAAVRARSSGGLSSVDPCAAVGAGLS
jgi:hypothetical protein